jgi:hypothetical protein
MRGFLQHVLLAAYTGYNVTQVRYSQQGHMSQSTKHKTAAQAQLIKILDSVVCARGVDLCRLCFVAAAACTPRVGYLDTKQTQAGRVLRTIRKQHNHVVLLPSFRLSVCRFGSAVYEQACVLLMHISAALVGITQGLCNLWIRPGTVQAKLCPDPTERLDTRAIHRLF